MSDELEIREKNGNTLEVFFTETNPEIGVTVGHEAIWITREQARKLAEFLIALADKLDSGDKGDE